VVLAGACVACVLLLPARWWCAGGNWQPPVFPVSVRPHFAHTHNTQEHFQPHFSAAGYDSWAVSLRGQGGSDRVVGASVAGTLDSHATDLAEVVAQMDAPPVMVAHSFGGLIAQK
jgi:alpha-beta hydrolase superfamily lysophospholipase